jgi:hypothetical protein
MLSVSGYLHSASEALDAIDSFKLLTQNWDSCGSEIPPAEVRAQAKTFLFVIERVLGVMYANPIVSPTPESGVALLWREPGQPKLQVNFSSAGTRYLVYAGREILDRGVVASYDVFAREILKRYISL